LSRRARKISGGLRTVVVSWQQTAHWSGDDSAGRGGFDFRADGPGDQLDLGFAVQRADADGARHNIPGSASAGSRRSERSGPGRSARRQRDRRPGRGRLAADGAAVASRPGHLGLSVRSTLSAPRRLTSEPRDFRLNAMSAEIHIGTQGWNYDAWVGPFYPAGTRPSEFLTVYARAFDTVEVDSTFYASPPATTIRSWADRTPKG